MPYFLTLLGLVGTVAMLWVGGGIIIHGLEGYGFAWLGHMVQDLGASAGRTVPQIGAAVEWLVEAGLSALFGLVIGGIAVVAMNLLVGPLLKPLDMSDAVCRPDFCRAVEGNVLLYRDAHHITTTYMRSMTNELGRQIAAATGWW
jgi:hypothetical protein